MLGLVAGYFRGLVDTIISRLIDIWMSFPPVLLSIVLAAAVGAGLGSVVLAIVVIDWTRFARVVRAETQLQRQLDYVAAARVIGLRRGRTLFAEILPNVLPLIVTLLTVEMGIAVIVEAILSFVGLSVSTDTPTWGGMIAEGRQVIYQVPGCSPCRSAASSSPCLASTSSATGSAPPSTRCSGDDPGARRP